ncbi:hypothetical protein SKAU_G00331720 [Synaphobranchus kaupii]|uniref:Uncharacterized protein n=1 Tax=Synaphobranchus kaupii TaxID=118154 RepID=A0A9Q1EL89_SYNKA|nr:hypothetical protein SKAU_G00331720 [Synaphobranchus kaupii]
MCAAEQDCWPAVGPPSISPRLPRVSEFFGGETRQPRPQQGQRRRGYSESRRATETRPGVQERSLAGAAARSDDIILTQVFRQRIL